MKKTIQIEGMSCHHCVHAVQKALDAVEDVSVEHVEIGSATIDVVDEADLSRVKQAIEEEGYSVFDR